MADLNKDFGKFDTDIEDKDVKYKVRQNQQLTPIKAILEKSNRKWEFVWDGSKISAVVTCDKFYNDLANGRVSVKPKDTMFATVKIKQRLDIINNVYINESYEVIFVESYSSYIGNQFNS